MQKNFINNFLKYFLSGVVGLIAGLLVIQSFYYIKYGKVINIFSALKNGQFSIENYFVALNFIIVAIMAEYIITLRSIFKKQSSQLAFLQKALQDKDKLLGYAAHVLRTSATGIKWGLESILEKEYGPLSKEEESILKKIYGSTKELLDLVEDYIDLSKLRLHIFKVTLSLVSVPTLQEDIKNMLKIYSSMAKEKNIKISHSFCQEKLKEAVPSVMVDKLRFLHSVENIIENAVNYTYSGGEINFSTSVTKDDFLIAVSDTGIGISEEDKSSVFSEFFRSEEARHIKSIGSGIGLFLVQLIVRAHRGKVWFDSVENKGTTFYIQIPLYKPPLKPKEKLEVFLKNI